MCIRGPVFIKNDDKNYNSNSALIKRNIFYDYSDI